MNRQTADIPESMRCCRFTEFLCSPVLEALVGSAGNRCKRKPVWYPLPECGIGSLDKNTRRCGNCGIDRRICTSECDWGEWQGCKAEGVCEPETTETEDCGGCGGSKTRSCTQECTWEEWAQCQVPDGAECSPEDEERRDIDNCGEETRTCLESCSWGPWQASTPAGVCEPGDEDARSCGGCRVEVRTCTNDCTWGPYGACLGEGQCEPEDQDESECGNCGTRVRTCGNDCIWGDWGSCSDEGPCEPGDVEEEQCGTSDVGECQYGARTRTCSNMCEWREWGPCRGNVEPSFDSCGNGEDEDCDGSDARNEDEYEPNDDCLDAAFLGEDPDVTVSATIDTADDTSDYYYFDGSDSASPFREYITLTLRDVPSNADYDLYLYHGYTNCTNDNPMMSSTGGRGEDEDISWGERWNYDDGGEWYVRVRRWYGNACYDPYTLTVDGLD